MPLKFTPKQESELEKGGFQPLPPGEYPFTVMESKEVLSRSPKNAGKPMVKLKINVHGPNYDVHVYDYFADWFSEWKLKHCCETIGLGAAYDAGEVDADCDAWTGRHGTVKLTIEKERIGDDGKTYPPKNVVADYIAPKTAETPAVAAMDDDGIPF